MNSFFGDISVKSKLNLLSGVLLVLIVVISLFSLMQLKSVKSHFMQYSKSAVPTEVGTLKISRDTNYVSRLTRSIMLGDDFDANMTKLTQRKNAIEGHFTALSKDAQSINDAQGRSRLLSLTEKSKTSTLKFINESIVLMQWIGADADASKLQQAWQKYKSEFSPLAAAARKDFSALNELINSEKKRIYKSSADTVESSISVSISILVVSVIIGVVLSQLFSKSIITPLTVLRTSIERIAANSDLTVRTDISNKDELGTVSQAFDSLVAQFHQTLEQVVIAANNLSESSSALAESSANTSDYVNSQRAETEMVATAMNQMAVTATDVAKNAADTAQGALSANEQAQQGQQVVQATVQSINELAKQIDDASDSIDKVSSDTQEIGRVLDVIGGIAEQTNLLALNAAIEAARAGEQGRGFAVVADEVRSLASRTESSIQEIQQMIERLQTGANEAVNVMNLSKKQAERSVSNASEAGGALDGITSSVASINDMAAQIACAAEEQTSVNEEINRNITNISTISDSTAVEADNTHQASHNLASLAVELDQQVSKFRV
ncbi:methyl-accepting chemotaxis protein [Psychrobium sp. 1_MG-2023]|uniref:methyl-accepting chemotaxis protein n=1 Tax=Psychrobium sp. 1_MG-2023 TaxID=3062624 RepID=UPI000C3224E7|nr:HAMP domain-containing methyl-accepting chemotaxis protein [Psychrobium sp. 1_MG-2023]MDP2561435.1 HAMP domain-containing methyl-accepting chemotaxis protein [Psychrobium sp. 1_MG-2023]PKF57702.1 methyl-accepting chemotaxis protein [Alteromonadales bacterium alter-6D02]